MNPTAHRSLDAEATAIRALGYLAGEPEALGRFLALSGIDPGDIRSLAGTPEFLAAVLDHFLQDEPLLLAFSANAGLPPAHIQRARFALSGPDRGDGD